MDGVILERKFDLIMLSTKFGVANGFVQTSKTGAMTFYPVLVPADCTWSTASHDFVDVQII